MVDNLLVAYGYLRATVDLAATTGYQPDQYDPHIERLVQSVRSLLGHSGLTLDELRPTLDALDADDLPGALAALGALCGITSPLAYQS